MYFNEIRDGFTFCSISYEDNVKDTIEIDCIGKSKRRYYSSRTLEETIEYINEHQIEKCTIEADDISFIDRCPSLKSFAINGIRNKDFDYSPLYRRSLIEWLGCDTEYEADTERKPIKTPIDFARFENIKSIGIRGNGAINIFSNDTIEEIETDENKSFSDFCDVGSKSLLRLSSKLGGLKTLDGIGNFPRLEKLNLHYQYGLKNIDALEDVSGTLKQLYIERCGKIKDFSVLEKLSNLEILVLDGNGSVENLQFLNNMPNLKYFKLWMKCIDGDMTPCIRIPCVRIQNRRHYNMKDEEMNKNGAASVIWYR